MQWFDESDFARISQFVKGPFLATYLRYNSKNFVRVGQETKYIMDLVKTITFSLLSLSNLPTILSYGDPTF